MCNAAACVSVWVRVCAVFVCVCEQAFGLPKWFGTCTRTPPPSLQVAGTRFVAFYCPQEPRDANGNPYEYNQLATLLFSSSENAIKQLFYFKNDPTYVPGCMRRSYHACAAAAVLRLSIRSTSLHSTPLVVRCSSWSVCVLSLALKCLFQLVLPHSIGFHACVRVCVCVGACPDMMYR